MKDYLICNSPIGSFIEFGNKPLGNSFLLSEYFHGTYIPVLRSEAFVENYPDYALLFTCNHTRKIVEKEEVFRAAGGKWIVYVPQVAVLD